MLTETPSSLPPRSLWVLSQTLNNGMGRGELLFQTAEAAGRMTVFPEPGSTSSPLADTYTGSVRKAQVCMGLGGGGQLSVTASLIHDRPSQPKLYFLVPLSGL